MEKYLFKSNIFARLSEIVEADSEKEVMDKIRNQKSFEIKQEDLKVYPESIEITKIKEKKEKNNMELKETIELMCSENYKERFIAEYHQVKIRYEKLKNFCNKTEMIEDMLERQKKYDAEVFKKHNITSVSRQQLEIALFDELGELMHAQKADWCWWKFTQEPVDVDKVIEEYIDVVHFALMYEIKFGSGCYTDKDIEHNYIKLKYDLRLGQAFVYSCVICRTKDDNVLAYVIALGLHMGLSLEEIRKEYIRKNEINKERVANGY